MQVKYHKDVDVLGSHDVTEGLPAKSSNQTPGSATQKAGHQYMVEMAHRPGVIVGESVSHTGLFANICIYNDKTHPWK